MDKANRKSCLYRMDLENLIYFKYCKGKHPEVSLSDIINDGVNRIAEGDIKWQEDKELFTEMMDTGEERKYDQDIDGTL